MVQIVGSIHGLSPLARGTQDGINYITGAMRFIPAGAGNTKHCARQNQLWAVYPRWRGEHTYFVTGNGGSSGLSPLARGTQN